MTPASPATGARRSRLSEGPSNARTAKPRLPASDAAFLGRGWSFPPAFNPPGGGVAGGVEMVGADEDIRQSIGIILTTEPGERAMQPDFGCPLRRFVFQRMDATTQTRIKDAVYRALLHWEPRIVIEEIRVEESDGSDGIIRIGVEYAVRSTNSRFNLVFPYHVAEGSQLLER